MVEVALMFRVSERHSFRIKASMRESKESFMAIEAVVVNVSFPRRRKDELWS
jgi:hypothetical protein